MGSNTSKEEANAAVEQPKEEDDEPDEWTGDNARTRQAVTTMFSSRRGHLLTSSYIAPLQMETFKRCWKAHGNDQRTSTQDADSSAK
ncbi:hypothetical protein J7T55_013796 [Diaporthe amygdali]|uniref:uncharacterized protein n=1 Tax=Phomopsis amygdali TaxID=1214568 RepID=UPI0022FE2271|nr:uncharacterized protein J7T55_013796 [Diaporthe amygdali]KAJ0119593.1 hypothetical protein J7T55_013796 [Diaporthe amygdali]